MLLYILRLHELQHCDCSLQLEGSIPSGCLQGCAPSQTRSCLQNHGNSSQGGAVAASKAADLRMSNLTVGTALRGKQVCMPSAVGSRTPACLAVFQRVRPPFMMAALGGSSQLQDLRQLL